MGLSSLLSSDEGLASVVKAKIEAKVNANSATSKSNNKKTIPSLNIIKNNLDKKIGTIANSGNEQIKLPIQNLISGKFQPRKHFDQTELDELAESIRSNGILQPILCDHLMKKVHHTKLLQGKDAGELLK